MTTLVGVIADTHVPQRLKHLPPGIAQAFEGVQLILHAGDINEPRVLKELSRIAPVVAVLGNADLPWWNLPLCRVVQVEGCRIGLTHGHGGWRRYLKYKIREKLLGFELSPYLSYARHAFKDAGVIVIGHTHRPYLARVNGVLFFNPGPVAPDYYTPQGPTVGVLRIEAGAAQARIVPIGD